MSPASFDSPLTNVHAHRLDGFACPCQRLLGAVLRTCRHRSRTTHQPTGCSRQSTDLLASAQTSAGHESTNPLPICIPSGVPIFSNLRHQRRGHCSRTPPTRVGAQLVKGDQCLGSRPSFHPRVSSPPRAGRAGALPPRNRSRFPLTLMSNSLFGARGSRLSSLSTVTAAILNGSLLPAASYTGDLNKACGHEVVRRVRFPQRQSMQCPQPTQRSGTTFLSLLSHSG